MSDCICIRFADTGGYRIADLTCPVHGVSGADPGDGPWETDEPDPQGCTDPACRGGVVQYPEWEGETQPCPMCNPQVGEG